MNHISNVKVHLKTRSGDVKLSLSKPLHLCKIQRSRIIGGTQIITNKRKIHLFDKIIHFSMQFTAVLDYFIVKT